MISFTSLVLLVLSLINIQEHWLFVISALLCLVRLCFDAYLLRKKVKHFVSIISTSAKITTAVTETIRAVMIILILILGYIPLVKFDEAKETYEFCYNAFQMDIDNTENEPKDATFPAFVICLTPNVVYQSVCDTKECLNTVIEISEFLQKYQDTDEIEDMSEIETYINEKQQQVVKMQAQLEHNKNKVILLASLYMVYHVAKVIGTVYRSRHITRSVANAS